MFKRPVLGCVVVVGLSSLLVGCVPLEGAGDVSGTYAVAYDPAWSIYEDGELIAEVQAGDSASVELSEGVLVLSQMCESDDASCPEEALWGRVQVEHPAKDATAIISIVNLDTEVGALGTALPGLVEGDGTFRAFAGADPRCGGLEVGTVTGIFDEEGISDGLVAWDYQEGCEIGGLQIDGSLRIEAAFEAELEGPIESGVGIAAAVVGLSD